MPAPASEDCSAKGAHQQVVDNVAGEQEAIDGASILVSKGLKNIL